MAWNGSGGHNRVHNWVADKNATINITASRMDAEFDDVSTALENCITRNGENSPTADLPMNSRNHTGVKNATGLTQYAATDQVVKGTLVHAATASAAGTDTYAVSLAVSPVTYSRGQVFSFIPDVANTGACSVNFNSIGAGNIKLINGLDPYTGAIQASKDVVVRYDGTNFILMNPYNFTDLAGIVVATAAEINALALSGITNASLVKLQAVTSSAVELNYVDVAAIGTVEASKAVVVDANRDALGFGKITASSATGYTASFTYTGTTNSDRALVASVTMAAGITYAFSSESQSTTSGAAAVYAIAYGATGAVSCGYFESRSNAGFGLQAVTTVAGGIPLKAASADAEDINKTAIFAKGLREISFNPRSGNAHYNPAVGSGDQVITAYGAGGAIDTGVLTLAPYATDAVGIRISSVTDTVAISGAITGATLTSPVLNGTLSGTAFLDEDAMTSNSAIAVPSQQSVKAYVDNKLVILDTPEALVSASPTNGSWQTVSSATLGTAGAKVAILSCYLSINETAGIAVSGSVNLRKTGSGVAIGILTQSVRVQDNITTAANFTSTHVAERSVGLDINSDFDWQTSLNSGDTTTTYIYLVGYYI